MSDAFNRLFDVAGFDTVAKALTLVLLGTAIVALIELVRYLRALRKGAVPVQKQYEIGARPASNWEPRRGGALRWTVNAVGVLSILALVSAAAAWPFVGTWLAHQDYPERAEYVVALPGDGHRLLKAAELYKSGFAPKILLGAEQHASADRLQKLRSEIGAPNTESYDYQLRVLEKEGVPRSVVTSIGTNLAGIPETAEAVKKIADDRRQKIIVVASGPQALRTRMIFQDVMPRTRFIVVTPPEQPGQDAAMVKVAEVSQVVNYWVGSTLRALRTESEAPQSEVRAPAKPSENLGSGSGVRR